MTKPFLLLFPCLPHLALTFGRFFFSLGWGCFTSSKSFSYSTASPVPCRSPPKRSLLLAVLLPVTVHTGLSGAQAPATATSLSRSKRPFTRELHLNPRFQKQKAWIILYTQPCQSHQLPPQVVTLTVSQCPACAQKAGRGARAAFQEGHRYRSHPQAAAQTGPHAATRRAAAATAAEGR